MRSDLEQEWRHRLLVRVSYSQAVFTVVQELLYNQDEQSAPVHTKCVRKCFCFGPDWLGSLTSCIPDHRKSYAGRAQQQAGTDCFCAHTWYCRASGDHEVSVGAALYKISATMPDEINPTDNPAGIGLFRTNNWLYLQGHGGTSV